MSIAIVITDGPLPPTAPAWIESEIVGTAGAILCFEGLVRAEEDGRRITALRYEVYEPMASRELHRLSTTILREFGLLAVQAAHSRGDVLVGQPSFRLRLAARHRAEGLRAMAVFLDRLKQDVPIWKTPIYALGRPDSEKPHSHG